MQKEELLIKRLQEDIRKWDLKISKAGVEEKNAKGRQKKEYEKEISDLSVKISDAKKEIEKLQKKIEKFPESRGTKTGPIVPPRSTG